MLARNTNDQFSDPVPAGKRWIVRHYGITYLGVTPTRFTLNVHIFPNDYLIDAAILGIGSPTSHVVVGATVVLEEGEQLHLNTDSEGVDCIVSGYELAV